MAGKGDVVKRALKVIENLGLEMTPNGIRAYHGSPYKFDKFDISKLGTGEGAQAYGHGLYFAGKEDIAKWYRDKLSRGTFYSGERIGDMHPSDSPQAAAIHSIAPYIADGKDPADAIAQQWAKWNASYEAFMKRADEMPDKRDKALARAQSFKDVADELLRLDPSKFTKNPGHMYEVGIDADPNRLLDWNEPLRAQPTDVRESVMPFAEYRANVINKARRDALDKGVDWRGRPFSQEKIDLYNKVENPEDFTGQNVYKQLQIHLGANNPNDKTAEASKYLTDQGVHGIKFLDASSRAPGIIEPTNNLVIPEDKRIQIIRRYADGGEVDPYADEVASAKKLIEQKRYEDQPWSEWAGDVADNAVRTAKAILPTALGGEGKVGISDMARGAYKSAKDAVTFPGDVLTGKQALYDENGVPLESAVGRSFNAVATIGGASSVVPVPENSLRVFGGTKSMTADKNALAKAQIMESNGDAAEAIRQATGWRRGAEGRWRYEISDEGSTTNHNEWLTDVSSPTNNVYAKLGDYFTHDALYAAYPEFKNMEVKGYYGNGPEYGYYLPRAERSGVVTDPHIGLNLNYLTKHQTRDTLLHEIQHAIQQKEGFVNGSSPSKFAPDTIPNPDVAIYEDALVHNPALKEYQATIGSPEWKEAVKSSNDFFNKEYAHRFKELENIEDKTGQNMSPQYGALSNEYEAKIDKMFPIFARAKELNAELRKAGIPVSKPQKQFLEPMEAYHRTAGEVEARNVQHRKDWTPEQRVKTSPEETQDYVNDAQYIDWNNTSWRKGYDIGGVADADRDIESALMTARFM